MLCLRLGVGVVRGKAGGAADRAILAGQLAGQQFLGGRVVGDLLVGQEGDEPFLEGAKAAFDFAFGLGGRGDQVRDAQRGEGALELRAGIAAIAGGLVAEQGQAIGVEGQGQAVQAKGAAEVLEVMPGGIGGHKDGGHELARVVIDRQQEGLLVVGGPPLMDRGIVLPEFAHARPFPAAAGLGSGCGRADQEWQVATSVGGDGFAIALESKAGGQFIGHQLVIGWTLERQEALQELLDLGGPGQMMVAPGKLEPEGSRLLQPGGSQAKEVSATDAQELGGGFGIEVAAVERIEDLVQERESETFGELMFFKGPLSDSGARSASLFVGLRADAPASSKAGAAGGKISARLGTVEFQSHFVPPAVSFCSRPNRKNMSCWNWSASTGCT